MPILVIAVVAFIIFLILMGLVLSAVMTEQREAKRPRLSDADAFEAAPSKAVSTLKPA